MKILSYLTWNNGLIVGVILSIIMIFIQTAHIDTNTVLMAIDTIAQSKPLACINSVSWFYFLLMMVPVGNAICFGLIFKLVGGAIRWYGMKSK